MRRVFFSSSKEGFQRRKNPDQGGTRANIFAIHTYPWYSSIPISVIHHPSTPSKSGLALPEEDPDLARPSGSVGVGGAARIRKKGAGVRTWLLLGTTGQARVVEAGRHVIMWRTGLPARDFQILDLSLECRRRHQPEEEAPRAPVEAAAAGSTPTPGRCSWTCSTAEGAARHGDAARSAGSLDQLRGPSAKPLISGPPSSLPEVERNMCLNSPKGDESGFGL